MALIRIEGSGFPQQYGYLNSTWDERWWTARVALAAFVMGRHPRDRFEFGPYSLVDMLHRVSLVWANLRMENDRFVQSAVYEVADRSEKAGVSYALGQTLAHLFVTRFLQVPYTMHVDRYAEEFGVTWRGRRRWKPDLMGLGQGWVVVEAKGRTRGAQGGVLEHAAEQKWTIGTIGGEPPTFRLASVAHFSTGPLSLLVSDPEVPVAPIEIPGDRAAFLRTYYRPLAEATRGGYRRRLFGRVVRLVDFDGLDMSLGLETGVANALSSDSRLLSLAEGFAEEAAARDESDEQRAIGADGTALVLGNTWREESLSKELRQRQRGHP